MMLQPVMVVVVSPAASTKTIIPSRQQPRHAQMMPFTATEYLDDADQFAVTSVKIGAKLTDL